MRRFAVTLEVEVAVTAEDADDAGEKVNELLWRNLLGLESVTELDAYELSGEVELEPTDAEWGWQDDDWADSPESEGGLSQECVCGNCQSWDGEVDEWDGWDEHEGGDGDDEEAD